MSVILATQEVEIRRIVVQDQPQANSSQYCILGLRWGGRGITKKGDVGVVQEIEH
jgi:hypothetical protein